MGKSGVTSKKAAFRFEAVNVDSLFEVLDGVAWMDSPSVPAIAQYADIDPRTARKLLKNARIIGLIESPDDESFVLARPYPYQGTAAQKHEVVREALLRLPLMVKIRQFLGLGNDRQTAMRKAATVAGERNYDAAAITPLVRWAERFKVLDLGVRAETLVNEAVQAKEIRHHEKSQERIAFISHSSKNKPFVRQLAADLVANGIKVWLDEQRIRVGDSIPEKIAQGLAESDFYLVVNSKDSVQSAWVQKELNGALVREIERRRVAVLPMKIDDAELPESLRDKKYANFSKSYEEGLREVLEAVKAQEVTANAGEPEGD